MSERTNTALHPFTPEQSKFMEEHYGLLQWFLSFRWVKKQACEKVPFSLLKKEDIYDAALDGYMRAVQQYDERPELQRYRFTTVAMNAMRWELLRLIRKEARRRSLLQQDNTAYETALRLLSDTPVSYGTAEENELWDRTKRVIVVRQENVLRLCPFGHAHAEIAEHSDVDYRASDKLKRKKLRLQLAA